MRFDPRMTFVDNGSKFHGAARRNGVAGIDTNVNGGLLFPKEYFPINENPTGFTLCTIARGTAVLGVYKSIVSRCATPTPDQYSLYLDLTKSVQGGVEKPCYAFGYYSPTVSEEFMVEIADGDSTHLIVMTYDRRAAHGSRFALYVDGVLGTNIPVSNMGTNPLGVIPEDVSHVAMLGTNDDVNPPIESVGYTSFVADLKTADKIAIESKYLSQNYWF